MAGLGPVQQLFMVARGEEKTAAVRVLELLEQHLGQLLGEFQIGRRKTGLQEFEQRCDQQGVIIQVGGIARGRTSRCRAAAVPPHLRADNSSAGAPRQ